MVIIDEIYTNPNYHTTKKVAILQMNDIWYGNVSWLYGESPYNK